MLQFGRPAGAKSERSKQIKRVLGTVWWVRLSGKATKIRVDRQEITSRGRVHWIATNLSTGRRVRIRSLRKLRRPANGSTPPLRALHGPANDPPNVTSPSVRSRAPLGQSERCVVGACEVASVLLLEFAAVKGYVTVRLCEHHLRDLRKLVSP